MVAMNPSLKGTSAAGSGMSRANMILMMWANVSHFEALTLSYWAGKATPQNRKRAYIAAKIAICLMMYGNTIPILRHNYIFILESELLYLKLYTKSSCFPSQQHARDLWLHRTV